MQITAWTATSYSDAAPVVADVGAAGGGEGDPGGHHGQGAPLLGDHRSRYGASLPIWRPCSRRCTRHLGRAERTGERSRHPSRRCGRRPAPPPRAQRPAADRGAAPPPRHGGGPRPRRHRPPRARGRALLGPVRPGLVFLRTRRATRAAPVDGARSFDDLYESAATFDEVYAAIVEELVVAASVRAPVPIVYRGLPGSPLVAERSVDLLRADDGSR